MYFCAIHKKRTSHQRSQIFFRFCLKLSGVQTSHYLQMQSLRWRETSWPSYVITPGKIFSSNVLATNGWVRSLTVQQVSCASENCISLETIEFFLNVCTEFTEKIDIYCILKRLFEPATSCVRDQDATAAPARQVAEGIFKLSPIPASVIYQIP